MTEKMLTILPGASIDLTSEANGYWCIDKVFCDSPFCSFSARASNPDTGLADRSAAANGIFTAADSSCKIASTAIVKGPFDKLYVNTTSDSIRVHICQLDKADVEHLRFA